MSVSWASRCSPEPLKACLVCLCLWSCYLEKKHPRVSEVSVAVVRFVSYAAVWVRRRRPGLTLRQAKAAKKNAQSPPSLRPLAGWGRWYGICLFMFCFSKVRQITRRATGCNYLCLMIILSNIFKWFLLHTTPVGAKIALLNCTVFVPQRLYLMNCLISLSSVDEAWHFPLTVSFPLGVSLCSGPFWARQTAKEKLYSAIF